MARALTELQVGSGGGELGLPQAETAQSYPSHGILYILFGSALIVLLASNDTNQVFQVSYVPT